MLSVSEQLARDFNEGPLLFQDETKQAVLNVG
jgi:hypothetical protein